MTPSEGPGAGAGAGGAVAVPATQEAPATVPEGAAGRGASHVAGPTVREDAAGPGGSRAAAPTVREDAAGRRAAWTGVLALVAVLMVAYARPLFLGQTFVSRDHPRLVIASRTFLASSLAAGHVPEWWDGVGFGEAFAADPNNGVTYPLAWPLGLLPSPFGADALLLVHLLLAGVGTLLLARRWGASATGAFLSGAAFMLSGYCTSMVVSASALLTLAWLPFVAWAADHLALAGDRRRQTGATAALAAFLALSMLAGNPSGVISAGLVTLVVALARAGRGGRLRATAWCAAAAVAAPILAALAVVPGTLVLADSYRGSGIDASPGNLWSLHPLRVVEWIWPFALGHGLRGGQGIAQLYADTGGGYLEASWAGSLYVGAPLLLLAALGARRLPVVAGAAGAFVVLALGRFTPVYAVFRALFLPEHYVRYPEKHLAAALLFACALAGVGFTRACAQGGVARWWRRAALAVAAVLGAGDLALVAARPEIASWLDGAARAQGRGLDAGAAVGWMIEGGALAAGSTILVLALLLGLHRRLGRLGPPLAAAVVALDLTLHVWALLPLVPRAALMETPAFLQPVAAGVTPETPPPRVYRAVRDVAPLDVPVEEFALFLHHTCVNNTVARFGFAQVPGENPAQSRRFGLLAAAAGASNLERLFDLVDVQYALVPESYAATLRMPVRAGPRAGYVLLENLDRRPRAFVAARHRWVASDEQAFADMFGAVTDKGGVRLTGRGQDAPPGGPAPVPCAVSRERPEHVGLDCASPGGGYAVYLVERRDGWSAALDGAAAPLERADGLFLAVRVGPGHHRVELRYRTPGLRAGAAVSGAAWIVWLGVVAFVSRRPRRAAPAPAS